MVNVCTFSLDLHSHNFWNFTTHVSGRSPPPGTNILVEASSLTSPMNATLDPSQSTRSSSDSCCTGLSKLTVGLVRAAEFELPWNASCVHRRRSHALIRLARFSSPAVPHSMSVSGRCNSACRVERTSRHVTTSSPALGPMSNAQGKSGLMSRICVGLSGVSGTRRNSYPQPANGDDDGKWREVGG